MGGDYVIRQYNNSYKNATIKWNEDYSRSSKRDDAGYDGFTSLGKSYTWNINNIIYKNLDAANTYIDANSEKWNAAIAVRAGNWTKTLIKKDDLCIELTKQLLNEYDKQKDVFNNLISQKKDIENNNGRKQYITCSGCKSKISINFCQYYCPIDKC